MTPEEIREILQKHKDWKNHKKGGEQANLQGAYLRGADLRGADLRGANLRGANLQGANLYGANLQGANLRGANLRWAHLRWAHLQKANLQGANLRGADLRWANLQGANLRGANLRWAHLQGANLRWANLQGADLQGARYAITSLLRSNWYAVSDALCLEMMRFDAIAVGTEAMTHWANGGECPFKNQERELIFQEEAKLWKPGASKLSYKELWRALCKEKDIKIDR